MHFSKDARDSNLSPVREDAHYIGLADIAGKGDLLPAIYGVLKTMSTYEGSTDV